MDDDNETDEYDTFRDLGKLGDKAAAMEGMRMEMELEKEKKRKRKGRVRRMRDERRGTRSRSGREPDGGLSFQPSFSATGR